MQKNPISVLLIGAPGTGKGTQSRYIVQDFAAIHVAPGNILRKAIEEGTFLGKKVNKHIEKGNLAPEETVMACIDECIAAVPKDAVLLFDGYPRTLKQSIHIEAALKKNKRSLDLVIHLGASPETLIDRLIRRKELEGRSDDNPKSIQRRLEVHALHMPPILARYKAQNRLHLIREGSIQQVYKNIKMLLESYLVKAPSHGA